MVKLVKIVDNKYVQIEEYKNPNICFNTNEYSDFEDYCTLRETFDPFEIFYENQELKSQLKGTTYCFDEEEHNKLKEENQELKKHLKVPKTCNLKTLEDYKSYYEDTTREQILEDTYIEYCAYVNLAHRYSELKKQIENCYCNRTDCAGRIKDSKKYDSLVQTQEAQQKEFIKFLEDELLDARYYARDIAHYIEYVLRKYKEIVNGTEQK